MSSFERALVQGFGWCFYCSRQESQPVPEFWKHFLSTGLECVKRYLQSVKPLTAQWKRLWKIYHCLRKLHASDCEEPPTFNPKILLKPDILAHLIISYRLLTKLWAWRPGLWFFDREFVQSLHAAWTSHRRCNSTTYIRVSSNVDSHADWRLWKFSLLSSALWPYERTHQRCKAVVTDHDGPGTEALSLQIENTKRLWWLPYGRRCMTTAALSQTIAASHSIGSTNLLYLVYAFTIWSSISS